MSVISWLPLLRPTRLRAYASTTPLPRPPPGSLPVWVGSPLTGRVSHPLDDKQSFMMSSHHHSPLTSLAWSHRATTPCTPVPTGLYEDVDQVTVLIHRAPEILALTVDRHEDFVQEPRISESTLSSLQLPSVVGAELPAPLANGFVGHDDSSFGQQILNIPEAHAVSVVEPDGMADDFGRKAMPMVAGPASVHPGIVPGGELT